MAKEKKQRANKYEEKVSFEGTFEDMLKISTTGAGAKKKERIIRTEFTKNECDEIRGILRKKVVSNTPEQKKLRDELRDKYNFYIEEFTNKKGFSDADFDELLKSKLISCI